ncbi:MAG: hypothetical protein EXS16_05950 [Gemmataceae bacterium]|nr:hypothetical protein [Gemmataceae bacterium]
MMPSLCESCKHMRPIQSARSRFLLCELATTNKQYVKYPPQPVVACSCYEPKPPALPKQGNDE